MSGRPGKRERLASLAGKLRLVQLLERLPRRPCLLVFVYHRVGDPRDCEYDRGVIEATPQEFDEQVGYLKSHFEVTTMAEVTALAGRPSSLRQAKVLLTFDDGYLDNYETVFPILKSHGVEGTFFLPTSYIGTDRVPWWDQIAHALRLSPRRRFTLSYPFALEVDLSGEEKEAAILSVLSQYKHPQTTEHERFLSDLEAACGIALPRRAPKRLFMSWPEALAMAKGGMVLGSHTHSHELLAPQSPEHQQTDLRQSRELLQRNLSVSGEALAYPVGSPTSFSDTTRRLATEAGYKIAFSNYGGVNLPSRWDPLNLLRIGSTFGTSHHHFRLQAALAGITGKQL